MDYREYVVDCALMVHADWSPSKPKGVCGADADTIACRNFLRQVAAGSGCYTHVVENTARRLKELAQELQAEGKKPKYEGFRCETCKDFTD